MKMSNGKTKNYIRLKGPQYAAADRYVREHKARWLLQWHNRTIESFCGELAAAIGHPVAKATLTMLAKDNEFPAKREPAKQRVSFSTTARLDALQTVILRMAEQLGVDSSELEAFQIETNESLAS
jgi:hypothetical protein